MADMNTSLVPLADLEKMAQVMGRSGLFGKNPEQIISLMLIAQAEGLHPATVAQEYDIIKGRPALTSRATLSRFQRDGGVIEWVERTDTKCAAQFSHPTKCPKPILIEWDMERVKRAQVANAEMYQKYPRQMLSARVQAEGVRACDPACLNNQYTVEEVEGMPPMRNVTPREPEEVEPEPPKERPRMRYEKLKADSTITLDEKRTILEGLKAATTLDEQEKLLDGWEKEARERAGVPA